MVMTQTELQKKIETTEKLKILFLTNIISPYMHDLFCHLAEHCKKTDFKVAACAYTEPDREWGIDYLKSANYKYEVLKDARLFKAPGKNRFMYFGGLSLLKEIPKYDALVFKGGTRFIGPFYTLLGKIMGKKTILWEENTSESTDTLLKNIIKPLYINKNLFSSFIAYGSKVQELIEKYNKGISEKIFLSGNSVNNKKYRDRYLKLVNKKNLIRKKLGISPEKKVALFVGRFVEEKNLSVLVDSIEKIVKKGEKNILCIMIGGGFLHDNLVSYTKDKNLEDFIKIIPFKEFEKLSMFYASADIFVLPSKWEVWGLVVNEAMLFNLPVIVSDKVGCSRDLIKNGCNGFVFPYKDSEKLAECILNTAKNDKKMGENSYKIVKDISFESACKIIVSSALV